MEDISRPALIVALVLLFVVLTSIGPGFMFGIGLSELARWVLIGGLIYLVLTKGCCGARSCRPTPTADAE